jgi:hypothetical protein
MLKTSKMKTNFSHPSLRYYHSLRAQQLEQLKSFPALAFYIMYFLPKKSNDAMDPEPEVRINAINKEDCELFNRRTFSLVQVDAVHLHANINGTRIVTRLKHIATIDDEAKTRLIIQGCQDAEKNWIYANAPTVSHAFIRILISIAAIKDCPAWTEDATQALLQSKNTFSRDLYAMLPLELRFVFKRYVLKILKPVMRC